MATEPLAKDADQVAVTQEKMGDLNVAMEAVLVDASDIPPEVTTEVRGFNFNDPVDFEKLMATFYSTGFQATSLASAIKVVNDMIACKFAQEKKSEKRYRPDCVTRDCGNCTIFLAYTSNLVSSGLRDIVRFLVEHNYVDVIVTTAGGIEEDFIKCLAPTYVGDFHRYRGAELRRRGVNRIGNLFVPNTNYCAFENWIMPIFDELLEEQRTKHVVFTPSKLIARLGAKIDNPDSIYYWAYKNNIPVFCPALTDGSIGDMLYFHAYKNGALMLDIVDDLRTINSHAVYAEHSGMIILGGGVVKHHVCNANLMRNGADYSVFVNTASEFDGSDAGAQPDEAVSWGKIRAAAQCVKVFADATLVFPLLVAQTFAKYHHTRKLEKKRTD